LCSEFKLTPVACPSSPFVFVSERGFPFPTAGFARMIERAAAVTGLGPPAHMPRHVCGYALANKVWLGHRWITGTATYTAPTN
jgi:hypothetical protein